MTGVIEIKAQTIKLLAVVIAIMLPLTGYAQMAGHNTKGDMGMFSGTQAPPGFYVAPLFYDYSADTVRDKNGDKFAPLGGGGDISASAGVAGLIWVTEKKFLGGNYLQLPNDRLPINDSHFVGKQ